MREPRPNSSLHEPLIYRLRAFVTKPANLLLVFFLGVLVVLWGAGVHALAYGKKKKAED